MFLKYISIPYSARKFKSSVRKAARFILCPDSKNIQFSQFLSGSSSSLLQAPVILVSMLFNICKLQNQPHYIHIIYNIGFNFWFGPFFIYLTLLVGLFLMYWVLRAEESQSHAPHKLNNWTTWVSIGFQLATQECRASKEMSKNLS